MMAKNMGPSKSQEAKWRAEDDMNTMMRYQEIMGDKKRVTAAQKMAAEKAKEAAKVAAKLKKGKK